MTTKNKVARRKLSLLDLASELNNVSKACQVMGYSRQQFYEIRRNFQTYGAQGLLDRLLGPKVKALTPIGSVKKLKRQSWTIACTIRHMDRYGLPSSLSCKVSKSAQVACAASGRGTISSVAMIGY